MPDPTPDEAAARLRKDADEFESVSRGAAVPTSFAAAFWTRYDAVLTERDGLRTELLTTQQILAHAERQRDEAEARLAAQQPVIDAAQDWCGAWVAGSACAQEGTALHAALARYEGATRAALLGSVEADTPAEPDEEVDAAGAMPGATRPACAPPAVGPSVAEAGAPAPLTAAERAELVAYPPLTPEQVAEQVRITEEVVDELIAEEAGAPAAEPAPAPAEREFFACAADLSSRAAATLHATANAGSRQEQLAAYFAAQAEQFRALAGAGAPTEPADDTQETT